MYLHAEDFSAERAELKFFPGDRHEEALREASEPIILTGEDGQKVQALYLNQRFAGNVAIHRVDGFTEDPGSFDVKYTAYQYAVHNPENPILFTALPAHGESSSLTGVQRREAFFERKTTAIARSHVRAARSLLAESSGLIAVGQSGGGLLAPDMVVEAARLGWEPKALICFDPVGLDKRPSLVTTGQFIRDGFLAQRRYHKGTANQHLDFGLETFNSEMARHGYEDAHHTVANVIRIYLKEPSFAGFVFVRSPFSGDGGFDAIERAMEANPDMEAAFVSGGLDKVTRWNRIASPVQGLLRKYPGRMGWTLWPFDGHAMGIGAQQPRFAAAVATVRQAVS